MKHLCFTGNNEVIVESPDRTDIKLTSKCIPNNDILDNVFGWLIEDLKKKKQLMPRHVLFCETIADVSKLYTFFVRQFGINCDLIDMFHSKTNDKIKEKIKNDMAVDGKIRLLICTNSAGMGVNFYGLHNIIHYGLPREMDTFVQQMGRCGRDGQFSHELILYKAHKGHLKKVETDLVKLAKDNTECRRLTLCNSYLINKSEIAPIHNCCDVCEKNCECSDENCPNAHITTKFEKGETPEDQMNRTVTKVEKRLLKQRLVGLKLQLSGDSQTHVLQPELIHGLTGEVISDIVVKSEILFTPDDVMNNCQIWSYETGVAICNIITQIFGDEEMYNIDEDTSTNSE
jgi:ATP-dependent DNA helicase RecQ